MHSISLILIGVLFAICPYNAHGTTTEPTTEIEEPKILPLTDALKTIDDNKLPFKREVWQEDDREVLIRNERGTKENGSTTGKKQKDNNNKKDKNIPKNVQNKHNLNKPSDTNSEININNTTQETVKKHQHQLKHEKHEKNINNHNQHHNRNNNQNNKKHASTEKPKQKDESKRN